MCKSPLTDHKPCLLAADEDTQATACTESLLCDETHALTSLADDDPQVPQLPVPTEEELREALAMRLKREANGSYTRNAAYLADVQRHHMEAVWREKMCRWMFETGRAFELIPDTVASAIHFMDQYLSVHSVDRVLLQLLAMVCMYVASKMHESQPISMEEMELLCEHKFSRSHMMKMENKLLGVLKWQLSPPVSFTFARDFVALLATVEGGCEAIKNEEKDTTSPTVQDVDEVVKPVIELLEIATTEYSSLQFSSSVMAMAAVHVLVKVERPWLHTAITKAVRSLRLPSREHIECFHYLRKLFVTRIRPSSNLEVVGEVHEEESSEPAEKTRELTSPTSVEQLSEPSAPVAAVAASTQSSSALKRLFVAEAPVASHTSDSSSSLSPHETKTKMARLC